MRRFPLLAASTLLAGIAIAQPAAPPAPGPQIGKFGFDESGMDRAAAPGEDFARFASGGWEARTQIPADRPTYGMFHVLQDLSESRTRTILEAEQKVAGSKPGDLYASFMDEAAAEAKGIAPLKPALEAIAGTKDKVMLASAMGGLRQIGVGVPLQIEPELDDKAPDRYAVKLSQGGLGLPDRDYYLKDDPKLAAIRTAYAAHLAKLLTLAGEKDAAARAAKIVAFETGLATVHWSRVESRDRDKTYNKLRLADITARAPGFDFAAFLKAADLAARPDFIVEQPSALTGTAKLYADTPLPVLKDYAMVRTIEAYAPYLSKAFVDESFDFNGRTLNGTPENRARWKRGVRLADQLIGEAVGQKYVATYFPPESKAAIDALVKNVIAAMDERLQALPWMVPETKAKARAKLAAFKPKIAYPDTWRDYSAYEVKRDDLVGNVMRGRAFDYHRNVARLDQPADRAEWFMTPMTINAYANPVWNEIAFPAAILQPPFFDPKADPAVNYGGIGAVIGHEISHHFDDQGRKYDARGALSDWWTPQDVARFKALTDKFVAQVDAYEPIPGQHVQGALTLGENIGDLAGLTIAYQAYKKSLNGKPAPVIDGFTGDQRFYLGWAQVWRTKYREPALRQQLLSDPHAPGSVRANVVRNLDPWYDAFKPKGGKLVLSPEQRVKIW